MAYYCYYKHPEKNYYTDCDDECCCGVGCSFYNCCLYYDCCNEACEQARAHNAHMDTVKSVHDQLEEYCSEEVNWQY